MTSVNTCFQSKYLTVLISVFSFSQYSPLQRATWLSRVNHSNCATAATLCFFRWTWKALLLWGFISYVFINL